MITAAKPDLSRLPPASSACSNPPRINTYKSVSKQRTSTPPLSHSYKKHGGRGWGSGFKAHHSFTRSFEGPLTPFASRSCKRPSRKSFPCHSCENMGGVPPLVPASTSRRPRNPLTPLESALTDSSPRKSFRIRSYEKHRGRGYILQAKSFSQPPNRVDPGNRTGHSASTALASPDPRAI